MADNVFKLIENGATTGNPVRWKGGTGIFKVNATWSGATIKLQYLGPDGVTWRDVGAYTTMTADGEGGFTLDECYIKATVSGGPPSGVYATAGMIPSGGV